ncbi:hypothetical protein CEXT_142721 [Caerostris extrusa]|uniref:Uncharacterized protein n=1 Tax=Caerostris extrusa TaxID=172846 RepID=A0AAV4ULX6_CAEEX|nr:hypothetical protein CEXT_142721 [Caerostris extrusa]
MKICKGKHPKCLNAARSNVSVRKPLLWKLIVGSYLSALIIINWSVSRERLSAVIAFGDHFSRSVGLSPSFNSPTFLSSPFILDKMGDEDFQPSLFLAFYHSISMPELVSSLTPFRKLRLSSTW